MVIPGEEVKTDRDGEVIGLFLREEIPRGLSFVDTLAAIREQEGVVYVPHPFDRMHSIPAPATLHKHLPEIDVLEVYNARLLFDGYNDEALRFARKYGLCRAPARTPTCCRGSAPARFGCDGSTARRSSSSLRTASAAPAEVARAAPVAQVGRPDEGARGERLRR